MKDIFSVRVSLWLELFTLIQEQINLNTSLLFRTKFCAQIRNIFLRQKQNKLNRDEKKQKHVQVKVKRCRAEALMHPRVFAEICQVGLSISCLTGLFLPLNHRQKSKKGFFKIVKYLTSSTRQKMCHKLLKNFTFHLLCKLQQVVTPFNKYQLYV